MGPVQTPTLSGARYFISFVDDHSKWIVVYMIHRKSEAFGRFDAYQAYAELHTGKKIKTLHTDNGGKYLSSTFKSHLSDYGIQQQLSISYTPQKNGVAERLNCTLMDLVRSMLHHSAADNRF